MNGIFLKRSNNLMSLIGTKLFFTADMFYRAVVPAGTFGKHIPYRAINPILGTFISIKF